MVDKGDNIQDPLPIKVTGDIPRVGQRVKYSPADFHEWKTATTLSRAGKATGMYKNWLI